MTQSLTDLSRCAIHTQTNKPWTLKQCAQAYAKAGVKGISIWRHVIEPIGAKVAGKIVRDHGLSVPAIVRGGFFTSLDAHARSTALDNNRTCIDEAHQIGAEMIVLVVGATPGLALEDARKQVAEGIASLLPHARAANVKLAIEPLHPMYAADKSCVNRMADARKICQMIDDPLLGIAADVYHTWWDPDLETEIALAGKLKILFAFHICDWLADTKHMLTDRGLMGEGVIDLRKIRSWVQATGFAGFNEIEIFSERLWAQDQQQYLAQLCSAYLSRC